MADRNVTARVDYLRAEHMGKVAEEVFYNYEDAMRDLDKAIAFAIECKNPSAWIAALNLKQKISGLHVEERKNDLSPVSGMSAERVKAALEALQALRKAKCNV